MTRADTFEMTRMTWVNDESDMVNLVAAIEDAPVVVYDLETTGLDEHAWTDGPKNGGVAARISLASFTLPTYDEFGEIDGDPVNLVLPLSHPDSPWLGKWRSTMARVAEAMIGKRLVGHNIKYDHRWTYACTHIPGVPAGQPVFDPEDSDIFEKGHISNTGYWRIYQSGGPTSGASAADLVAERALGPKPDGYSVDHWNRDRLDNRRANLRYVTRAEQMQNRGSWGKSGVRGAYEKPDGTFEAAVTVDGKRVYLGVHSSAWEAGDAVEAFQTRRGEKPPESVREVPGIDLASSTWWDTQISSHLLDETVSTKLKERAPDTFGVPRWDDVDLTYPGASEDEPLFKLGEYAARDTYWTWRLYESHRERMIPDEEPMDSEEIEDARLGMLARWCAMPTTATLTGIEQRGMALDRPWVESTIRDLEQMQVLTLEQLTGRYISDDLDPDNPSFAPTSHWFKRWAELAVENGDLKVAALTPTGKPQWSKSVLGRQARNGSMVAASLLAYRDATKRLEFLRAWLKMITKKGRIHTTYHAGSVVSGRLSSSGPNMQQVTKSLRPAFVPSKGYVIADLDYSQIELRVAAFISGSDPMMSAYVNGEDLHTIMAARISGKPADQVTPGERQAGKAANFGLLYGMGAYGFKLYAEDAYGVVFTDQEAAQVHQTFFETWNGIRQWHAQSVKRLHETGQVISPIGRVRRLPGVFSGNDSEVGFSERAAINSPVQGFASDIMQIAASCIEGNIPGVEPVRRARLVGTVHDSIVVEVPEDGWQEVVAQCKEAMERTVPQVLMKMGCDFDIPLQADATVGTRWSLSDVGSM